MTISYDQLMTMPARIDRQRYTERDTMLYGLGVGAGITAAAYGAPGADAALRTVYEADLEALPTMAVVLATPGFWLKDPEWGSDWTKILHGEQMLTLHRPIPVEGHIRSELTIDEIYDKGPGKGAVLYATRRLFDEDSGDLIATVAQSSFMRGDGGCGGKTSGAPQPTAVPERAPDLSVDLHTRPEQALIYRLLGDYNPLHADPVVADQAGFPGPILHGLCTYGVVGRGLRDAARAQGLGELVRMDVRFSSPVFPGETISTDIWWDGASAIFRARVAARDQIVLNNGIAAFG